MFNRRSPLQIIESLLSADQMNMNQAITVTGLNWSRTRQYLNYLIERRLMDVSVSSHGTCYVVTASGKAALPQLRALMSVLGFEDSDEPLELSRRRHGTARREAA